MVNAALLYLFERASAADQPGVSSYSTVMRQHGAVTTNGTVTAAPFSLASLLPIDSRVSPHGSALLVAILVALASEHGYALFRSAARHVLERALWRSSVESQTLERSEWQSRRTMLQLFERKGRDATPHQEKESLSSFWSENDAGKQLIQDVAKME
jgi:anoctamin-10